MDYDVMTREDMIRSLQKLSAVGKCHLLEERDEEIEEMQDKLEKYEDLREATNASAREIECALNEFHELNNGLDLLRLAFSAVMEDIDTIVAKANENIAALDNISIELGED